MYKQVPAAVIGRVSLLSRGISLLLERSGYQIEPDLNAAHAAGIMEDSGRRSILIILEDDRPAEDIADTIKALRISHPAGFIVVMYRDFSTREIRELLSIGADGVLPASIGPEGLLSALNLILSEEIQFVVMDAKATTSARAHDTAPTHPFAQHEEAVQIERRAQSPTDFRLPDALSISDRESAVLQNLIRGDSNKMIARRLSISEATVKIHVRSLLRKIGAENRTQAAIMALNECMADTPSVDFSLKN